MCVNKEKAFFQLRSFNRLQSKLKGLQNENFKTITSQISFSSIITESLVMFREPEFRAWSISAVHNYVFTSLALPKRDCYFLFIFLFMLFVAEIFQQET